MYLNDRLGRHQRPAEGKGGELESGTEVKKANQDLVSKVKNIPSHKYNIKNEKDAYTANIGGGFWDDIVNRNRLFYCAHMNRKNAFF